MEAYTIALFIFCIVAIGVFALYAALSDEDLAFHRRFEEMALELRAQDRLGPSDQLPQAGKARSLMDWAIERLPPPKEREANNRTAELLAHAGFMRSNALAVYRLVRLVTPIAGAFLGEAAALAIGCERQNTLLLILLGGLVGAYLPVYWLHSRIRKRTIMIARELSDVLDLLVVCVESGLGLAEAIKIVGEETERHGQAIGAELTLVSGEISAGGTLGDALRNLAQRTAVEDLKPLAATLIQSEQLGSQIGPVLRASSDALRTRRRLRAEEAAQKTTIKILFPLVLFVLPAMLMVILVPALIQAIRALNP